MTAAEEAVKKVEEFAVEGQKKVEEAVKKAEEFAAESQKKVEEFAAEAQKKVTAQYDKATKTFEDAVAFNQETVDALVKSSELAAKAVEEYNAEVVAFAKKSVEDGVAAAKELAAIKDVKVLLEKQAELAKSTYETNVAEAKKLNEMAQTAAKEVFEPLQARAVAAQELLKSYAA